MQLDKQLNIAKKLAIEAGNGIMEIYNSGSFEISQKGDKGPLTKADILANNIIVDNLRKEFPDYSILTEEEADDKKRLQNDYVWIIDPLDGTKEFIARNGEFTVNVALVHKHEAVLGVVYAPARQELFFASKNDGAYLEKNGKMEKVKVSDRDKISEMFLVQSRSHPSDKLTKLMAKYAFAGIRACGSSLKGCMIAEGEADVYFRLGPINEWDICAMNAIVNEAGGILTTLDNEMIKYNSENPKISSFIVSNNEIHEKFVKIALEID